MQYQSTVTLTTHHNASFVQKVGSDGVHQGGGGGGDQLHKS